MVDNRLLSQTLEIFPEIRWRQRGPTKDEYLTFAHSSKFKQVGGLVVARANTQANSPVVTYRLDRDLEGIWTKYEEEPHKIPKLRKLVVVGDNIELYDNSGALLEHNMPEEDLNTAWFYFNEQTIYKFIKTIHPELVKLSSIPESELAVFGLANIRA